MLGGAYSDQYKNIERQHVDTIKTFAENEKHDAIARARKLSIETNKRRRALAIKRKAEAEKEEKRRRQILAKRREKQNEATERFQRGHISSRPSSSNSSARWSPRQTLTTRLDEALKIVRGSPSSSRQSSARGQGHNSPTTYARQNSDPLSKPYFNKYAHPSINQNHNGYDNREDLHTKSLRNLNSSRNLFEQQLQSHQQSLLNQQQKALQEFNKQVMKEIEVDKNVTNVDSNANGVGIERSESISTVDSLEDTESNDTLRESCDIDKYLKLQDGDSNNRNENSKTNSKNGSQISNGHFTGAAGHRVQSAGNTSNQTIDSYNTQVQSNYNQGTVLDPKQQQYYQRQQEIQQQLQEQQQKQKEEMEQKVWEQQQKQKQLVQQQYQRQQQEQIEKQRQQELLEKQRQQQEQLEKQRQEQIQRQKMDRQKHQEMIEKQKLQEEHMQRMRQEAENQRVQQQQQAKQTAQQQPYIESYSNTDKTDGQRPKIQMKAWATPSPVPPTPVSTALNSPHLVTNASPYTGKPTHTNMTTTVGMHDKTTNNAYSNTYPKSSAPTNITNYSVTSQVNHSPNTTATGAGSEMSVTNSQVNKTTNKAVTIKTEPSNDSQNLSFLEKFTRDLTGNTNLNSQTGNASGSQKQVDTVNNTPVQSSPKTTVTNTNTVKPVVSPAIGKPSAYYQGSYGANYAARQHSKAGGATGDSGKPNGTTPHTVAFMIPDAGLNGDDTADTDSVSTICDEKEPEPKEIKGILKRTGSANGKKTGILKKSGSTGNLNAIKDSLEITRVHLVTAAEDKEQRMLRELERGINPSMLPPKKNVRFADLSYDDESENSQRDGDVNNPLFAKRKDDSNAVTHKPPRPASAVAIKTNSIQMTAKPPRASSATVRTSTIPRAKTQVVRPIVTQPAATNDVETKKKVTIINNDFMQKIPAMARNNQTVHTVAPTSVYTATPVTQVRPQEQKVNYAVSSIIMPKSNSAPFVYPGYVKQGPVPTGSNEGPSEASVSSKYEGAMFDENGLRIDRTPTDDEINFLWDKLKSCLNRNTGTSEKGQIEGHRQAAPVANTYIDGNALGQYNSLNRVAQHQNYNGVRRQNSLDSAGSSYAKRYGLLQQRRQQPNPNSLKSRQLQGPVQSHTEPQPSPGGSAGQDLSESMAGFLVAEHLADTAMSESTIHQAIDDAQSRQQNYNTARPQPKAMSALSIEEKHVLESLDRLNEKLKVSEVPIPNGNAALAPVPREQSNHAQPNQHQQQQKQVIHEDQSSEKQETMGGFKGHTPISQRRVIESATHKARMRITSAVLKKHMHHRNQ